MKTLSELKETLVLHYKMLERLEQKLIDTECEHEKDHITRKMLQLENEINSLEEKIKLLENN